MATKNVEIIGFLEKHFKIFNGDCRDEMAIAVHEFLTVAKYFGRSEKEYSEIKERAAKILYDTVGTVNSDYSPSTKFCTVMAMRTVLFQEARV